MMMTRLLQRPISKCAFILAAILTINTNAVFSATQDLFNEEGYRRDQYKAPTPDTAPGATTITAEDLKQRLDKGEKIGLIDVLPIPPRPGNLSADILWNPPKHKNIPGSLWLPDAGQPVLSPALETYFKNGLDKATGGKKSVPVVLYCREECWMSWNAAKRASLWGYQVLWYPGGVEQWALAGYPLTESLPEPSTELGR
jgi:PQQ-dependent catabolism-associated CXXCW motif protein